MGTYKVHTRQGNNTSNNQKEKTMRTTYQTIIVKFKESITELNGIFSDTQSWGAATIKEWIDGYESTRFTQTDSHTAVITSEYNMEHVKEWLDRHTAFDRLNEY